jgi:pSer/pThr/pTyr-binding forkhead associated (FHA) protein
MTARVILKASGGRLNGEEFVFTGKAQCVIGRSSCCSLRLPGGDPTVSRHHCLLDIDAPNVWAQGLGSLNGTFLNGQSIGQRRRPWSADETQKLTAEPHPLLDGDELRVGNTVFTVVIEDPADQTAGDVHPELCDSSI